MAFFCCKGGRERKRGREGKGYSSSSPLCRDEDDLYMAYAVMHSKPSTYLLTNDYQSCVRRHLPDEVLVIFEQWLRVRRAHVTTFRKSKKYKIQVQA